MDVVWLSIIVTGSIGIIAAALLYTQLAHARDAMTQLRTERDQASTARAEAEKRLAAADQKLLDMRERMDDWETARRELLNATKAAALETSQQVSSKLLEDHKRELESARKQSEEITKKTTEHLSEHFKTVTDKVAALKDSDTKQDKVLSTMWRALSSPAGAGELAEIGLENALKHLGLEPGRDFVMQYSVAGHEDGTRLRPDCVIFLPHNHVMVIDSKASKFVLELAEADSEEATKQMLARLSRSMNDHVRTLASKDYEAAIRKAYKEAGLRDAVEHIYNVMYVPSETAYAHIRRADPEFLAKAQSKGLMLASPTTLLGLLSLAKLKLLQANRAENQREIRETLEDLLDGMAVAFAHFGKAGDALKSAAGAFHKLAASVNRNVLPRARKLHALGIAHPKQRDLVAALPTYEIHKLEDALTLEPEEEAGRIRLASPKESETEAA